jgi:hypothetical protein
MTTIYTRAAIPDRDARLAAFAAECKGNFSTEDQNRRWRIVAAMSLRESDFCFRTDRNVKVPSQRDGDLDPLYPTKCDPARQVLGLEQGNSLLDTTMSPSWVSDSDLMGMLNRLGWLVQTSKGPQLSKETCATDGLIPNSRLAYIFEWQMDRRKASQLRAWSVGPTQLYLYYSPLAGVAGVGLPSRFPTWEKLYSFYMSTSVAEMFDSGAYDYLDVNSQVYPMPGAAIETVQAWLQRYQTGEVDWSTSYWEGYSRDVLNAINKVWTL